MTYTLPTAAEFKARHVLFADLTDAYVNTMIAEASRFVDETWCEDDYQPAIMFLAAHNAVGEGALGGRTDTSGVIASEKLGDASINYGGISSGSSLEINYNSTAYGKRYLQLLRVNQPAILIT